MASVGIVVRTKNECRWIGYCIQALSEQVGIDRVEIALVDCSSVDMTVERALGIFPRMRVVKYEGEYYPGKSINLGISALPDVDYISVLSAHCVPIGKDWLAKMVGPLEENQDWAASYCRQIPTLASTPENRRDLLNTFSVESRLQCKDTFFHNAASVFRRSVWEKIPFNDCLKHIEDRHWAVELVAQGYKIFYNAEAVVVHEHGLNQHDRKYRSFRGQGVSSLLPEDEKLVSNWSVYAEKHSKVLVLALTSCLGTKRCDEIFSSSTASHDCYILPKKGAGLPALENVIQREEEWDQISLFELLRELVCKFANGGRHYDYVYFFDADRSEHRGDLPDVYLRKSIETGADLCVAVESYKEDFFVLQSDETSWVPVNDKLMDLYTNKPHFKKALYGEGMLIRTSVLIDQTMPEAVFLDG